jgi:hypothetical protein
VQPFAFGEVGGRCFGEAAGHGHIGCGEVCGVDRADVDRDVAMVDVQVSPVLTDPIAAIHAVVSRRNETPMWVGSPGLE